MNISFQAMNKIFNFSKNYAYGLRYGNFLSRSNIHSMHFGIESIANITAKNGIKYLAKLKMLAPSQFLKVKLKIEF